MSNFAEIIERWPSVKDLASDMKVTQDLILKWRKRNNIPASRWYDLLAAARKRRIKLSSEEMIRGAKQ